MNNMELVLNALITFMDKPNNPASALSELLYMMEKYGGEAKKEFDNWKQEYDFLENENLQLRQMLKQMGVSFRSGGEAA